MIGIGIGIVVVITLIAIIMRASAKAENGPTREQRPFHICPKCSAYNAKVEKHCWRCDHDMSQGAIPANSDVTSRLDQLDEVRTS